MDMDNGKGENAWIISMSQAMEKGRAEETFPHVICSEYNLWNLK